MPATECKGIKVKSWLVLLWYAQKAFQHCPENKRSPALQSLHDCRRARKHVTGTRTGHSRGRFSAATPFSPHQRQCQQLQTARKH
jgi:hypothetical protein